MKLIETTTLGSVDFPIAELKAQLRLGTGFSDSGAQDGLLESCLRAAMGAIEARTGKILIRRRFVWTINAWRLDGGAQAFPVSPVTDVIDVRMVAPGQPAATLDPADYVLVADDQRPRVMALARPFPQIAPGGAAELSFEAGYGAWAAVPPDLRQAMLMLAALYYENRDSMVNGGGQIPLGVSALLEPYKRLRLGAAS
jgi:uncharacterized phiE125 gp8 family phage protein